MNTFTRLLRVVVSASTIVVSGQLLAIDVVSTQQVHLDARLVQTTQVVSRELLDRIPGPRGNSLDWLKRIGPISSDDTSKLGTGTSIRGIDTTGGMRIVVDGIQFNFTPRVAENGTSIGMNIVPMSAIEGVPVAPYRSTLNIPMNSSLFLEFHSPTPKTGPDKFLIITPTITTSPSSPSTQVVTAPTSTYSYSKWEVGAAYNYMATDEELVKGLHGFSLTGYYNFSRSVALGVQFGGYYGTKDAGRDEEMFLDRYSFMAGPRLQCASEGPVRPFGQILFGAVHDRVGVDFGGNYYSSSDTAFGMSIGGGINFEVAHHFTITPFVDYYPTFFGSQRQDNFRMGVGLNWHY